MKVTRVLLTFCVIFALAPLSATASCRQALVLALDVSGSVDPDEYRLQMNGVAEALLTPPVEEAFLMFPDTPVRLMVFEWSARNHQRQIVGWTEIRSRADLESISAQMLNTRQVRVENPDTAIGAAMIYGLDALHSQSDCWQKTLDISGDGPANIGLHPQDISETVVGDAIINGLIIGPNSPANINKNRHNLKTLLEYYEAYVLRGPVAFAEVAQAYRDFAIAMQRKLVRELQPVAVSVLEDKRRRTSQP